MSSTHVTWFDICTPAGFKSFLEILNSARNERNVQKLKMRDKFSKILIIQE